MNLEASYTRCLDLTRKHYENFPVARLVPKRLRPHVGAIYAFARTADDIADEGWGEKGQDPADRLEALAIFEEEVLRAAEGAPLRPETDWIFGPLGDTIRRFALPPELFRDLLSAFAQDVNVTRYDDWPQLLNYCRRSANPVGRLVLLLHNLRDDARMQQSDAICTALQLTNFWQDIAVDWQKGRIYIPLEDMEAFQVTEDDFAAATASSRLRDCLRMLCGRTRELFAEGRKLPSRLPFPLNWEIRATWHGGRTILQRIAAIKYDTLAQRPKLRPVDKLGLLLRAPWPL